MTEPEPEPMYITSQKGKKTRILTPSEFDRFVSAWKKPDHVTIFETLFYTGLRFEEAKRLHKHPEWVEWVRNVIHLPQEAQRKKRRRQLERYVQIAPQVKSRLIMFFQLERIPTLAKWDEAMKRNAVRAGFDPTGFSAKTTRKTIESWMIVAGIPLTQICLWQGHTDLTSLRHYQNLAFTKEEREEIRKRLEGWW